MTEFRPVHVPRRLHPLRWKVPQASSTPRAFSGVNSVIGCIVVSVAALTVIVAAALHALRKTFPNLGAAKLHAQLLAQHPEWTVSEKRTRKILQQEGLVLSPVSAQNQGPAHPRLNAADDKYPRSQLVEGLDVRKWTAKV